jgi:hypothetical protein
MSHATSSTHVGRNDFSPLYCEIERFRDADRPFIRVYRDREGREAVGFDQGMPVLGGEGTVIL